MRVSGRSGALAVLGATAFVMALATPQVCRGQSAERVNQAFRSLERELFILEVELKIAQEGEGKDPARAGARFRACESRLVRASNAKDEFWDAVRDASRAGNVDEAEWKSIRDRYTGAQERYNDSHRKVRNGLPSQTAAKPKADFSGDNRDALLERVTEMRVAFIDGIDEWNGKEFSSTAFYSRVNSAAQRHGVNEPQKSNRFKYHSWPSMALNNGPGSRYQSLRQAIFAFQGYLIAIDVVSDQERSYTEYLAGVMNEWERAMDQSKGELDLLFDNLGLEQQYMVEMADEDDDEKNEQERKRLMAIQESSDEYHRTITGKWPVTVNQFVGWKSTKGGLGQPDLKARRPYRLWPDAPATPKDVPDRD